MGPNGHSRLQIVAAYSTDNPAASTTWAYKIFRAGTELASGDAADLDAVRAVGLPNLVAGM